MDNLQQRNYYRIFSGTNQADGYENIHLGYSASTTEITFTRDQYTYFHVPFFTTVAKLSESTLFADGAEPGVIPAASDRILKKQGNYGQHTNWGYNTGIQDGTWLCSWLCSLTGETPRWLDRYYNPGRLAYDEALNGITSIMDSLSYINSNPAFVDIPSQMTLEPGVLYQYYHMGENTSSFIVDTLAGDNKDKLRLQVDTFTSTILDKSIYNNVGYIDNYNPDWQGYNTDTNYVSGVYLDFENQDLINARILYSDNYNLTGNFTFNFFVKHNDWANAQSSQLVGNYYESGFGIFYNNLHNYPYFVIPENTYGHILYFNNEAYSFLDQPIASNPLLTASPIQISLNGEREILVLDGSVDNNKGKYFAKFNSYGDIISFPHDDQNAYVPLSGIPKHFAVDRDNNIFMYTTQGQYVFDKDLTFVSFITGNAYVAHQKLCLNNEGIIHREYNCLDVLYDNSGQKWVIQLDGTLRVNGVYYSVLPTSATKLAVDPDSNIWVLNGTNQVVVVDPVTYNTINTFAVGSSHIDGSTERNVSFIRNYDRSKNAFTWYSLIYQNFDKILFVTTLKGNIVRTIFLNDSVDIVPNSPNPIDVNRLSYTGEGDFTGYEWSRICNPVVYDNNPQIQFKIATADITPETPYKSFYKWYTLSIPVQYFIDNSWYLITGIYNNHTLSLYVDKTLRDILHIPYNVDITYKRENDIYIGCPNGKATNINKEINSTAIIFNGQISNIKIYDYALPSEFIQYFLRSKVVGQNLTWDINTANLQYVEKIDRFFKHKMPGSKSNYFNLKITGTQIQDPNTRAIIENYIRSVAKQTKPGHTELLSIEWV
jgi:hypothetical protein